MMLKGTESQHSEMLNFNVERINYLYRLVMHKLAQETPTKPQYCEYFLWYSIKNSNFYKFININYQ